MMVWETSAGVFIKDGKMLMGKRLMSKDNYPGLWDVPAGHLDLGETPEQCVIREIKEEIGVDAKDVEHIFSFEETDPFSKRYYLHHVFFVKEWKGEITYFEEMERFDWFTLEEVKDLKKTITNEMCEKVFEFYKQL